MIQSDNYSYKQTRKLILPIGIIALVVGLTLFGLSFMENDFNLASIIFISIGGFYIFLSKNLDYYYLVKIDSDKIIYYNDNFQNEIMWDAVIMIGRIPLTTDYIIKTSKETVIFPTNNHYGSMSFSFFGLKLIWDFSDMGRFINKVRIKKNIKSPLNYYLRKRK